MTAQAQLGERLLSVSPSPAFWVALVAYTAASAALLVVLAGHQRARPFAIAWSRSRSSHMAVDIGWRGTQHVHPAQSVREAIGFLSFIVTGGYLLASTRYRLTLGGVVVMPVSLVLLVAARLTPGGHRTGGSVVARTRSTSRSRPSASACSRSRARCR